jgi:hypothetical protein
VHRGSLIVHRAIAFFLAVTCGGQSSAATPEESARLRKEFEAAIRAMAQSERPSAEPLSRLKGELTEEDGRELARLLLELSGKEMGGTAMALESCGAGRQAWDIMWGVIKDRARPLSQWWPSVYYVYWHRSRGWHDMPRGHVEQELQAATISRLRTKERDELLALLREQLPWELTYYWRSSPGVAWALCSAVTHEDAAVREASIGTLLLLQNPEMYIRTEEVRALVGIAVRGGEEAARGASKLLRQLLGIGPEGDDLEAAREFWAEWQAANGEAFTLRQYALRRAARPNELPPHAKAVVATQIVVDSLETGAAERVRAFQLVQRALAEDEAALSEREGKRTWLGCLVGLASFSGDDELQRTAATTLVRHAAVGDLECRLVTLRSMGGALLGMGRQRLPGSILRSYLEGVLENEQATLDERVMAACSLATPARADRRLLDRILRLAGQVHQQEKPPLEFFTRDGALWQLSFALPAVLGEPLPEDPAQWRGAFGTWRPMTYQSLTDRLRQDLLKDLPPGTQLPGASEEDPVPQRHPDDTHPPR